jgi:hypothetical protein
MLRHSNAIRRLAGVLIANIECVLPIGSALYAVEILVTLAPIVDAQQIVIDADNVIKLQWHLLLPFR